MNNKLLRGTLAGVAAIALAAGGSTFAAWSDFDSIDDNEVKADEFALVLNPGGSAVFDETAMRPGEASERMVTLAGRTGKATRSNLSMTLTGLQGSEDGCTNTNSEKADDADCDGTNEGEFIRDAKLIVNSYAVGTATSCDNLGSAKPKAVTGVNGLALTELNDKKLNLLADGDTLGPGQKVCVATLLYLPKDVNNASQGDSGAFDLDFLLEQDVSGSRI